MTEQGTAPVGQSDVSVTTPDVKDVSQDFVPLDTHKRLLDEKKKTQARLEEVLARNKERDEDDAKKRGDYLSVIKSKEDELLVERTKRLAIEESLTNARKMNAVIGALGGNVDERWHQLIDVSRVVADPETGMVDEMTVARMVDSLKREFPEIVRSSNKLPNAAPQGLVGGVGKITESDWKRLTSTKEQSQYKPGDIIWGS